MNPLPLLLAYTLHGVVDQMDNGVVRVEWHNGEESSFVPATVLPTDLREGDELVLNVRPRPGPSTPVVLPHPLLTEGWEATFHHCFHNHKGVQQ